jgi:hypothetical protein
VIALSGWWAVGWIAGAAVVVVAALLLVVITSIARNIIKETQDISGGLHGVADKTHSLRQVSRTHQAVARITTGLRRARGEGAPFPSREGGLGPGIRTPDPPSAVPRKFLTGGYG